MLTASLGRMDLRGFIAVLQGLKPLKQVRGGRRD